MQVRGGEVEYEGCRCLFTCGRASRSMGICRLVTHARTGGGEFAVSRGAILLLVNASVFDPGVGFFFL